MKQILHNILPAQALNIQVDAWNGCRVVLSAPLDTNRNDKGSAFAGSIDALLDLAGWSAITLALRDAGIEAKVMIVKSETEYRTAVKADMTAEAKVPESDRERMLQELNDAGRSRLTLHCQLFSGGKTCAAMNAHYAVIQEASS